VATLPVSLVATLPVSLAVTLLGTTADLALER
jgi:hypothetical protein